MESRLARPDEEPEAEHEKIVNRLSVPELVAVYDRAEDSIRRSFLAISESLSQLEAVQLGGKYFRLHTRRNDHHHPYDWKDPGDVIRELRRDIWGSLIERIQIRRAMSIAAWEKFEKQIREEEPPEVTIENIHSMVAQFREEAPEMLREAVDEVFNLLRPRGSEYKTNTEFEIGERVVLTGYVRRSHSTWDVDYYREQHLTALENVFRMVDGKVRREEDSYFADISNAIKRCKLNEPCRGKTEYFEFKGFKNGNMHLRFLRLNLVARLNAIAGGARLKPVSDE